MVNIYGGYILGPYIYDRKIYKGVSILPLYKLAEVTQMNKTNQKLKDQAEKIAKLEAENKALREKVSNKIDKIPAGDLPCGGCGDAECHYCNPEVA